MNLKNSGPLAGILATLLAGFGMAVAGKDHGPEARPLEALLPQQFAGWQSAGKDQTFHRGNLFDYMDGAGEIYLAYGFQALLVREYVREAAPSIVAEVYQMSSSEEAYGIFSHDTEGEEREIGQGAYYGLGLLRFWKGHFFVRLMAERETEETARALQALGQSVAAAIPQEGRKPRLVSCLPPAGLLASSVHYFHQPVSLNCHYYLAEGNVLNLNERTEAVLARYQVEGGKVRLLLVRYPRPSEARTAYDRFRRAYFPSRPAGASSPQVGQVEGKGWVSARRQGRFVILVLEASGAGTGPRLTEAVVKKLQEVFPWKQETNAESEGSAGGIFSRKPSAERWE
jgi:hypothetical protein